MSTFIRFGAQTISERNAAIAAIFPLGSQWTSLWDNTRYKVTAHDPHGHVVLARLRDGQPFIMWPHEQKVANWRREPSPKPKR